MITVEDIWSGDWHAKIRSRLGILGCETVTDLMRKFPCLPYFKLARMLGKDVAAVQLAIMQFEEAKADGSIRQAVRDALVRAIHQHLKRGWGRGIRADFHTAGAYAEWLAALESRAFAPELLPMGEAVWRALEEGKPPAGWLPNDPDDPIITAAFDKGWPTSENRS